MKNDRRKIGALAVLSCCALLAFCGCQSVSGTIDTAATDSLGVAVQTGQTAIAAAAHDLGGTIDAARAVISEPLTPEAKVVTLTKYISLAAEQKNELITAVDSQTKALSAFQLSRVTDNAAQSRTIAALTAANERGKAWASRFWAAATLAALLVAVIVFMLLKKI